MILSLITKIFGTKHDRDVKKILPMVNEINTFFENYESLTEDELKAKTDEFKQRLSEGEELDDLLPEAFANCREAARRALGLHAFDVQLMGGIFLHQGMM